MLSFPIYIKDQVFPCQLKINRDDAVNAAALFISIISVLLLLSRIELNPHAKHIASNSTSTYMNYNIRMGTCRKFSKNE